jgi:hypothetical protein
VLFDKALVDYSNSPEPRRIDGMMLTKFDTIDDKVGAAVSMMHSADHLCWDGAKVHQPQPYQRCEGGQGAPILNTAQGTKAPEHPSDE